MADLTTLRLKVRYRLGLRDDLTTGDGLTMLDEWINDAYEEIAHSIHFHHFEGETSVSTTIGDRDTPLDGSIYAILSAFDVTNSTPLDRFAGDHDEYERRVGTTNGPIAEYHHFADQIFWRPPPDAVVTVRLGVRNEVTRLTAASQSPIIPTVWHRGIEILAARNGWRSLGDDTRAAAIEQIEWRSFRGTVRTPRAYESYVQRRRGTRVRQHIRNRRLGV